MSVELTQLPLEPSPPQAARKPVPVWLFILLFLLGSITKINAQDLNFRQLDNNLTTVERLGVFTGASHATDLDGEGVSGEGDAPAQQRNPIW